LKADYPLTHEVIAYEAATLPISVPRVERFPLSGLPTAALTAATTLVIPPAGPMRRNERIIEQLRLMGG
jgi:hypothetical protein